MVVKWYQIHIRGLFMLRKRFGIRAKLTLYLVPVIVVAFIAVIAIAYSSSRSSIQTKTEKLLQVLLIQQ